MRKSKVVECYYFNNAKITYHNSIYIFIIEIFSSGFAAAAYFEQHPMPPGKKAYVIGHQGLCDELELIGISCIGGPNDNDKKPEFNQGKSMEHDPEVGAVVVGFDANINYYKIQYAQLCLSENKDCRFIATNLDSVAHLTADQEWAEAGAMVGAIKGCTGVEPVLVGKPSPLLVDYIAGKHGLDRARMCMVGDRLDTDIVFGQRNGLQTVLTLSGVTSEEALLSDANKTIPQYYVRSIKDFFPHIE